MFSFLEVFGGTVVILVNPPCKCVFRDGLTSMSVVPSRSVVAVAEAVVHDIVRKQF